MLCLGKLKGVILNFGLRPFKPRALRFLFWNQNKIGFSRYILCCNRIKKAKPRIAMFSRLCTDGPKGFLFGNFYLREFFTFSMQDFWPLARMAEVEK